MDVGKRISFFRNQKQISVNKLANIAGISQSYLRDIEYGNKNPTVEILSYICDALNISLKDFFDENIEDTFENDPIIQKLYQLSPLQRKTLLNFLETII